MLLLAACSTSTSSGDATGDTGEGGDVAQRPNWHEDVAPVVAEHCGTCHTEEGIAPFSMDTYAQTSPWSAYMAQLVDTGVMPPWHAVETETCTPPHAFRHDARLDDATKQLFVDWANLGAPEGDPANAAPLPDPANLDLPNPTAVLPMTASVTVDAEDTTLDFFHCLSFDPGNAESIYLDGIQVRPGNPEIAHHVLVYLDETGTSASWTDGLKENCGGGAGVGNATLISAWVPGSLPFEPPAGVGIEVPPGARLIFNYHYHATGAGPAVDDSTELALRYSTASPTWTSFFELVGAPGVGDIQTPPFLIPAGTKDHEEIVEWTVPDFGPVDVRVWTVANHMHKVGVDMQTSILRGDEETCLVQTPGWDFNWQRLYTYDAPVEDTVTVLPGDVVRVRCTYDNTLDNSALLEALAETGNTEPIDVELGEGTLDEMCLAGVGVAYRAAP